MDNLPSKNNKIKMTDFTIYWYSKYKGRDL